MTKKASMQTIGMLRKIMPYINIIENKNIAKIIKNVADFMVDFLIE
jgi:hypothetical protein